MSKVHFNGKPYQQLRNLEDKYHMLIQIAAYLFWSAKSVHFIKWSWQQVMAKRDELFLHQEVKLRNKLVEYLTDWVLPSAEHHQSIPAELSVLSK